MVDIEDIVHGAIEGAIEGAIDVAFGFPLGPIRMVVKTLSSASSLVSQSNSVNHATAAPAQHCLGIDELISNPVIKI